MKGKEGGQCYYKGWFEAILY